jgi:hypothetical protein
MCQLGKCPIFTMVAVEKVVKQLGFFYGIRHLPRSQGRKRNSILGRWTVTEYVCQPISRLHDLIGCDERMSHTVRKEQRSAASKVTYAACEGRWLQSVPACRNAPRNETKRRYFKFKRFKICERVKISIYFHLSCIIYLLRILLTH